MKRWNRSFATLIAAIALPLFAGCAGVPLLTMAKMAMLNPQDVIMGDASQYMIAFDVSSTVKAQPEKLPFIAIDMRPNVAGDFPVFERTLAFEEIGVGVAIPSLKPAKAGRKWIVYRLSQSGREGHAEFLRFIEREKNRPIKLGGAQLDVSISLDFLADIIPRTDDNRVEAFLQLKSVDGFTKLWSGNASTINRKR
jgi:hypothetical protein